MTIDQITEELKNDEASPVSLGEFYTQLSGWYSYYGQQMKRVQLIKSEAWIVIKQSGDPKPYSDAYTDKLWEATEDGQKEVALHWELKRIEQMMRAIKTRLYVDNEAARSLY